MSIEVSRRICKVCGELKDRILVGKFDSRNKKYHDETGKTWNGHTCPSCVVLQSRLNMSLLRVKRKNV